MTKIEQCAVALFGFIAHHDIGLHLHRTTDRLSAQAGIACGKGWAVLLQPIEKARIAQKPVFDHLAIARQKIARGKRAQDIDIDQHEAGLMKGTDQAPDSRQILWLAVAGLAVTAVVAIAFLPPFLDAEWRPLLMAGYRKVCHQLPGRSFALQGQQIALCHRCVGIWGAVPVAILLFGVLRRWDRVIALRPGLAIIISLIPLGVDWTADVLGLWNNTVVSRLHQDDL